MEADSPPDYKTVISGTETNTTNEIRFKNNETRNPVYTISQTPMQRISGFFLFQSINILFIELYIYIYIY